MSASREDLPREHALKVSVPAEHDTLIGRESMIGEIACLLEEARLVNLLGLGGVGKTRVAFGVAQLLVESYPPGGISVVLLRNVASDDAGEIGALLLSACGVVQDPADDPVDTLVRHFHYRKTLLVLDNCEHVRLLLAPMVDALLSGAADLRILATSRCPLGVRGEYLYDVLPLSSRSADGRPSEAARLLATRAAAIRRPVDPTDSKVARVCELLNGWPLAIELAASRLRLLSLNEVLDALAERPLSLTRDIEQVGQGHHQSLRATMDWSYVLLSPPERRMWAILSEFNGPFTVPMAQDVCAGLGIVPEEALSLVASLLNNSILQRCAESEQEEAPESSFEMIEAYRHYGQQLLPEGTGRDAILRAHSAGAGKEHLDDSAVSLTRRESEVVAMVAQGATNKEIAKTLVVSVRTIESHLQNAMAKANVSNRHALSVWHNRLVTERGLPGLSGGQ